MCFVLGPEAPEPAPRSRRRGLQARRGRGRPAEALFGRPRAAEERPRRVRRSRPPSAARQQLRRHRACQPACEARPVASRRQHGRIAAQRPRALRSIRADGTPLGWHPRGPLLARNLRPGRAQGHYGWQPSQLGAQGARDRSERCGGHGRHLVAPCSLHVPMPCVGKWRGAYQQLEPSISMVADLARLHH